ncbi:hypothetical protein MMC22_010276 [Lobaria immixta]|nr:hypothetical protein [Lobaria immixta]
MITARKKQKQFGALPDEAEQHRQVSISKTQKTVPNRSHAGSPAFRVRPRTGIGAKKFPVAVNAWKMYYDLDLTRGGKTKKEFMLTGNRVKTTLINRPIVLIEDMKEFIDLDLGHAIQIWHEIKTEANNGDTYLATDYNFRQKVTELSILSQGHLPKTSPSHELFVIIEVEWLNDTPYKTPVNLANKKQKALDNSPRIKEEPLSRKRSVTNKEPAIKQEVVSSPNLTEEEDNLLVFEKKILLGAGSIKVEDRIKNVKVEVENIGSTKDAEDVESD